MIHLIDASVWLASDDDSNSSTEAAEALLTHPDAMPAALDLTLLEVINVRSRRKAGTARLPVGREISAITSGRVMSLSEAELTALEDLCEQHPLSAYDGAYVIASLTRNMKLVSLDMKDLVEPGWAVTPQQALEAIAA